MIQDASVYVVSDDSCECSSGDSEDSLTCGVPVEDPYSANGGARKTFVLEEKRMYSYQGIKRTLEEPLKTKVKVPRLLCHDIRKCYPGMVANVLNSGNFSMLYGFLDTFFDRNVYFCRVKHSLCGEKLHSLQTNNLKELAKFWYAIMRMSPDNVTRLSESRIQYTTGNIISNLEVDATILYDAPMAAGYYASYILLDERYGKQILFANDKRTNDYVVGRKYDISEGDALNESKLKDMRDVQCTVDSVVDRLPLRAMPVKMEAKGTFVISTDENKRITKVEVHVYY